MNKPYKGFGVLALAAGSLFPAGYANAAEQAVQNPPDNQTTDAGKTDGKTENKPNIILIVADDTG